MKDPYEIVNNLSPDDALFILKSLASDDLSLATRVAEMALVHLAEVDLEAIAAELYDALEALKVEEVWDRAGKTRDGYVETGEAADQMIEEVLEPFLDEMKKYQTMGLTLEARHMCMGMLLGLYDFEHACTSEFKEWSPDSPIAFAGEVVDAWRTVRSDKADLQALTAFIEDELQGWGPNLNLGS